MRNARITVEALKEEADKPTWSRVGVLSAIGFVIGIAWPHLAGVRVGPEPPKAVTETMPEATPSATAPATSAAMAQSKLPTITVGRAVALSCRTRDEETHKGGDCVIPPALDKMTETRVRRLVNCEGVAGLEGKLSLVLTLDFRASRATADIGKSSTVTASPGIAACLRQQVQSLEWGALGHDYERLVVAYPTTFSLGLAKETPPAVLSAPMAPASNFASSAPTDTAKEDRVIEWNDVAVRDEPRTGAILTRLRKGSKVSILATKDGWVRVKYTGEQGGEGWVYRGALK